MSVSLQAFQAALSDAVIRRLKLIYVAQALGVLFFLAVAIWVAAQPRFGGRDLPDAANTVRLLTVAHLALAAALYTAGVIVYRKLLQGRNATGPDATAEGAVNAIVNAEVVRLALFEAVAFFGVAVCLVANAVGVLANQPHYWANLFSSAVMVGLVNVMMPTRPRLEKLFRTRIAPLQ